MVGSISREEYKENGYRLVWGIGDKDKINKYCKAERLLLVKIVDIDTALYDEDKPEGYVIEGIEGYERDFLMYKLGLRGFVVSIDGSNEEVEYFIKREKEYWNRAREIGKERKKKKGQYMGGVVPYGYYVIKKKLYVDDYESFVVKFVFYRYSQGCSLGGIAKELRLRGFKNRNGNPFKAGSIESILKNRRFYQGYYVYKDGEVKGDFRGILEDSEELLTKEWKNRVFDAETEAKIAKHKELYHSDRAVPKEIHPYIIADDHFEARQRIRRIKRGTNRSI